MKQHVKFKLNWDKTDTLAAIITVLVFGCFFFFFEVRELGDSHQHIVGSISREPVYAMFLKGMQILFGEENFHTPVGFVQNILAVISILYTQKILARLFDFRPIWRIFTVFCLLAPHLLTPLASKTHLILTNSILTEGITFSLFYVWICLILCILLTENHNTATWSAWGLSLFLSLIRGQMMVLLLVWGIVACYRAIILKRVKRILFVVLALAIAFAGRGFLVKSYNYIQNGFYTETTSGKPMMLANVVYVADRADGAGIQDEEIQVLFAEISSLLEKDKKTYRYAGNSLLQKAKFHESVHDDINFEYISPVIRDYIEEKTGINGSRFEECMMLLDEYSGKMAKELLPNVMGKYIKNYFVIASLGFIRSIGVEISVIPILVVIAYILAIALAFLLWKKDKNSKGANFMLLVLLLICGNVFSTSLMIQCISRYMIYNLPFFYIAFLVMLIEIWQMRKENKDVSES